MSDPGRRHGWFSPHVGERVELLRYGARGTPLLYVPTSGGDETEFARYGMLHDCHGAIAAGRIQVFAIDGRARQTFWNDGLAPAERIGAYDRFERYVGDELVPWVLAETGAPRLVAVGASYGAHVVANLLLRRPETVALACGLGGVYGLWHRLDGFHDERVERLTPLEYLPRLDDPRQLARIRAAGGIVLFAAAEDEWLDSTLRLARALRARSLPHRLDVWPAPASHHERWWRPQLRRFLAADLGLREVAPGQA